MTAPLSGRYEGRPRDTPAVEVHSSMWARVLPSVLVAAIVTVVVAIVTPGPAGGLLAMIAAIGALALGGVATYRSATADQDALLVRRRLTHDLIPWRLVHGLSITPRGFRRPGLYRFARLTARIGATPESAEDQVLIVGTGDLRESLARIRSVIPSDDLRRMRGST